VWSRTHSHHVDRLSIFSQCHLSVAAVVSEAVLDTNDNPVRLSVFEILRDRQADDYQRLVKTTPKPRATKNSSGELVGPLLFELVGADVAAEPAELVGVDMVLSCVSYRTILMIDSEEDSVKASWSGSTYNLDDGSAETIGYKRS